jgi:hypothetical protein
LENKPTFHRRRPISGPFKRRPLPANECQELFHRLLINPLDSINLDSKVEQPKLQALSVDETKRPSLGLAKKKLTPAESRRRHKLAEQNADAKREMLRPAGGTGALNGSVSKNIQTALRQPEAKEAAPKQTSQLETDKPAPKPGHTEEDSHFLMSSSQTKRKAPREQIVKREKTGWLLKMRCKI